MIRDYMEFGERSRSVLMPQKVHTATAQIPTRYCYDPLKGHSPRIQIHLVAKDYFSKLAEAIPVNFTTLAVSDFIKIHII